MSLTRALFIVRVALTVCTASFTVSRSFAQTTIATGLDVPFNLRLNGSNVYFVDVVPNTNFGSVKTVLADGGAASLLIAAPVSGLAIDGSDLYSQESNGIILRTPLAGGPTVGVTSTTPSGFFDAFGSNVYYANGAFSIESTPRLGGSSTTLATGIWARQGAVDSSGIYFDDYSSDTIKKYDFATSSLSTLAPGVPGGNDKVRLDGDNVYIKIAGGGIQVVPKAGGAARTLVAGNVAYTPYSPDTSSGYVVRNGYVYYADGEAIRRIPTSGGVSIPIAKITPGNMTSMASDGTYLYWGEATGNAGGGEIKKKLPVVNASNFTANPEVTTSIAPNTPPVVNKIVPRLARWDKASNSWLPLTEGSITSNDVRVLVHGWGKGQEDWVHQRIAAHQSFNVWDDTAWYEDWTNLAKSIVDSGDPNATVLSFSWLDLSATDTQLISSGSSRAVTDSTGELMARYLERALPSTFTGHLSLFGHSHGSRVAAIAAKQLETKVHVDQLTVADSPDNLLTNGVPIFLPANAKNNLADVLKQMNLGRTTTTTFVDNYVSAFGIPLHDASNSKLKNIVDVALFGPAGDITIDHGYPYRWFTHVNNGNFPDVGLAWSPVLGNQYQDLASSYRQVWAYVDDNGKVAYDNQREGVLAPIANAAALVSNGPTQTSRSLVFQSLLTQGSVSQSTESVTLAEPGTALWHGKLTTVAGDDTLTFDYHFSDPGDGDQLVIWIDDQLQFIMTGVLVSTAYESSTINLGDLAAGDHILSIGLYAFGNSQADVTIDNIAITSIPEPSAIIMLCIGMISFRCRRFRSDATGATITHLTLKGFAARTKTV